MSSRTGEDPSVAAAHRLSSQVGELADELVQLISDEIDIYQTGGRTSGMVEQEDLRRSLVDNLTFMLDNIARPARLDLTAPRRTGRQRAEQGAPLPEVLRAYRLSFQFLWDRLLQLARESGPTAVESLLDTATRVWRLADEYSRALTIAYRDAVGEQRIANDRLRSALVASLVSGSPHDHGGAWELAHQLRFPFEGVFLLVLAEAPAGAQRTFAVLDSLLSESAIESAWRPDPGVDTGVLSLGHQQVEEAIELMRCHADTRIGISPAFFRLDEAPRALRYAQIALEATAHGPERVQQLDGSPLEDLVTGSFEATGRVVDRVLGPVLALPDEDRRVLLSTAEAWLDARGSAREAGTLLHCHENTVRYRMRRLFAVLGRSMDDPRAMAELAAGLQALRTFPRLATEYRNPAVSSRASYPARSVPE